MKYEDPLWVSIFVALQDFAHSQENCEKMTDAVFRVVKKSPSPPQGGVQGSNRASPK